MKIIYVSLYMEISLFVPAAVVPVFPPELPSFDDWPNIIFIIKNLGPNSYVPHTVSPNVSALCNVLFDEGELIKNRVNTPSLRIKYTKNVCLSVV